MYNTQLQYLEIKENVFHDQSKFNVFIYFFFQVVCYICFFKSHLFADQMTQNLFKLARKKQQGAKLK